MIKLKNLIKEAYAWERKFGEKLPTLDSVQKKYGKKQLTEKKELDSKTIQAVSKMTDSNAHTHARIELAQALRNKRMEKAYRALNELNLYFGGYGPELSKVNQKMEKVLYKELQRTFANFEEIRSAL